jgi:uncharacterized membrane protein (Fun14 family)
MTLLSDLWGFILGGSVYGLPTLVVMAIPFLVGLVVGFLAKKLLKIAIVAGLILVVLAFFGFMNLSLSGLKDTIASYGSQVVYYAAVLLGVLPLGLGFIIGLALGFIFG